MSTALIAEYPAILRDNNGNLVQLPTSPPLVDQSVTFTSTASFSATALSTATRMVRIVTDAIAHIGFDVTASTTLATKVEARTPEYFAVTPGSTINFIQGS